MKALVVGSGIGGLTTALMLQQRGIDCEIFEQADQVRELGVGINTLPHAIRELASLGLLDRLDAVALRTHELIYTNAQGQEIWREPRGTEAGFDVPQFSIHRGRLQKVLYDAVRSRVGESRIHTGHRLGSFNQDEAGVTAYFFDRNGAHCRTARGDILIGADGIHSQVRALLFPNEEPPKFTGIVMWRGAIDWPKFLTGRSMIIAGGMTCKLVLYPIAQGSHEDSRLTNWATLIRVGRGGGTPRKEDWSRPGRLEDLMPYVRRMSIPCCDAKALIEATPEFWEYPLCDRDPLPRWSHGLVTLLGDAAHPMYPVGSNGASQAILDARYLADRLVDSEHPRQALSAYDHERIPKTSQIVMMNRKGGPEGVIDIVEDLAPNGFANIDDVLPYESRRAIVQGYASVAGFARDQVNHTAAQQRAA